MVVFVLRHIKESLFRTVSSFEMRTGKRVMDKTVAGEEEILF